MQRSKNIASPLAHLDVRHSSMHGYGVFAARGQRAEPTPVLRVIDRDGKVIIDNSKPKTERVLAEGVADNVTDVLRGVLISGTARGRGIDRPAAGKTGTTQENTDGWFIMMHPELVAGARVGFNEKLKMGPWGMGARSALPIVGEVFQQALRKEWIDADAEFGVASHRAAPVESYAEGIRDPWARWPKAREVFADVREQVRGMLP
jgi:penicillin-binding protein 1A